MRRGDRLWEEWEKEIIRRNFPTGGVLACKQLLPDRAETAIAKHAQKLGVKCDLVKHRISIGLKHLSTEKGRTVGRQGYPIICLSGTGSNAVWMLEHRYVMEGLLGRPLKSSEIVHHIDGDKFNNEPSNLVIVTRSEHMRLHRLEINKGKEIVRHSKKLETVV